MVTFTDLPMSGYSINTGPTQNDLWSAARQKLHDAGGGAGKNPVSLCCPCRYRAVMVVRDESEWLALLRAHDEPGELGQSAGLEFPRDFDRAAAQQRFERLAERLSDVFGCPLATGEGPRQDAALFGAIRIPPNVTVTRAQHNPIRFPVIVAVSNFGNLATCRAARDSISPETLESPVPPVHPEDQSRVDQVLNELGYLSVPADVLESRYDGPNRWVFGDRDETWYVRYFSFL